MDTSEFPAVFIEKNDSGQSVGLRTLTTADLPEGDVLVEVAWSTLNYKDALAITGTSPIVRKFPMVPGVDFSGIVAESQHAAYKPGDRVILNGWSVGEKYWGGLAGRARVKGDWLVPLPAGIDLCQAMGIGTAGYAAMLAVMTLERHGIRPGSGQILVTGASGGVGSVAVAVLAKLGYYVCAVTGRTEEEDYLQRLGARTILPREEFAEKSRPLVSERWAGAIDSVGTTVLANVLSAMRYGGVVASVGLAGGMDLPTTVAPFILRGVTLAGVDSVMCPFKTREEAWQRLARDLDLKLLDSMIAEISLKEVIEQAPRLLEGKVRGRVVVAVNPELV